MLKNARLFPEPIGFAGIAPAGDGTHYVCITNAYSFVNDSFDFEGVQWLGNRDYENGDFSILWPLEQVVFNSAFRAFGERDFGSHGEAGTPEPIPNSEVKRFLANDTGHLRPGKQEAAKFLPKTPIWGFLWF